MSDTTTEVGVIGADDLVALRMAETVSFHWYRGRGYIRASLDRVTEDVRIFSAREQRLFPLTNRGAGERCREIDVETTMYGYVGAWSLADDDVRPAAFHMISSARYSSTWVTVADLLRKGDLLTVKWVADNNNGHVQQAGLHADEMRLIVARDGLRRPMEFVVARSVCRDDSARMVRRYGN